jgi:D-3-phosphoglycerate dehydrogenase
MAQHIVLSTSPTFTKYSRHSLALLEEHGCRLVIIPPSEFRERPDSKTILAEASAWVVGADKVYATDLEKASNLKLIIKHGTGVDSIDVGAASAKGICVANAPGGNAESVADLAFGLMLALARQIIPTDKKTREGFWDMVMGRDLFGKTLGVLGLGQIGKGVVRRAAGFSMKALGYDIVHDTDFETEQGMKAADLDEIMAAADFITVHLPLLPETKGIIGKAQLAKMKASAYIVNTSRGGVVAEDALLECLQAGRIAGAALDVFQVEPPGQSAFFQLENVIVTPHMGAYTENAMSAISGIVAESIVRVLQGGEPLSRVRP